MLKVNRVHHLRTDVSNLVRISNAEKLKVVTLFKNFVGVIKGSACRYVHMEVQRAREIITGRNVIVVTH